MGKVTRKHPGLRPRTKKDGSIVWYLSTTYMGVELSERAGNTEAAALKYLNKRKFEIEEGRSSIASKSRKLTVEAILIEYYEKHLQYKSSKDTRKYLVDRLARNLGHHIAINLRKSDVEAYRRKRLTEFKIIRYKENGVKKERNGNPISANTVNKEITELIGALNWAVGDNLITHNTIATIKPLELPEPKRIMLDDGKENGPEWNKLYNAASDILKPKIFIQYRTGMRMGDVCGLKSVWIDLANKMIRLPYRGNRIKKLARNIPMYEDVYDFFLTWPIGKEFVFYGKDGSVLKSYDKQFNRAVKSAGLSREITTHALRRTRAQIVEMSCGKRISMAMIGHVDEGVHDRHYVEVKDYEMRDALNKKE